MIKLALVFASALALSAAPAAAQSAPSTPPAAKPAAKGTRLILLGTSAGPIASATRGQPALLLVVDGRPYLIDAGEGTLTQLKKAGFDAFQVRNVFLTHLHVDHAAGLAPILAFNWVSGRRQPVEVIGPQGTSAFVAKALDYLSIPERIQGMVLPPHPSMVSMVSARDLDVTSEKLVFEDDKVRVTAVENSHYSTVSMGMQPYGIDRSLSYRFMTADRTIVFTGDTGPSAAVEKLARGADILVSEVLNIGATARLLKTQFPVTDEQLAPLLKHMTDEHLLPEEVGKLAARADVGMVVLSHIAPATDEPINPLDYTAGIRKHYNRPVVYGKDFLEF